MRAVSPQTRVIYAKGSNLLEKSSLQVVPAIALRHTDANGNQTEGLKAEYFNNPKLKGNPDITQSDAKIDFDWQDSAPTKGIHADLFSVRWSGQLLPTVTGKYELGFSSDDGFRLTLDGKTRIEDWSIHAAQTTSTEVELEAGKSYDLKVEYFEQRAGASAKLLWAPPQATDVLLNQAVDAARQADVVIAVLGISPEVEGETHDREDINLPPVQQELLHALYDTGKPVVAVLLSGSALAVNWADAHIPAILQAWYPGEEGGTAIADVIFGDYNPAGRMPITAYKSLDQVPEFKDYDVAKGRTYRYFSGEPLYPFGYGLSYSSFDYSDLKIEPASLSSPTTVTVSAEIRNVGKVAGEEVPQLYLKNSTAPDAHALTPLHHLEGFKRVYLNPGETKTVSFQLTPKQYAIVNSEGKHVLATGKVQVYVGGGQPDQVSHGSKTLNGQFEMTGESQILQ
jgi:beta-glucosidase